MTAPPPLNTYRVGIMSQAATLRAPSAEVAALYFAVKLATGIIGAVPFGAIIYSENGQKWGGDAWWLKYQFLNRDLTEVEAAFLNERIPSILSQFKFVQVLPEEN